MLGLAVDKASVYCLVNEELVDLLVLFLEVGDEVYELRLDL